jgi:hypothetical protein
MVNLQMFKSNCILFVYPFFCHNILFLSGGVVKLFKFVWLAFVSATLFLFASNNQLSAFDKTDLKQFANAYFTDMECQIFGWSEFVFAVERDYDEIALFYLSTDLSLDYIRKIEDSKRVEVNKIIPQKVFYNNIVNTLVRKNKATILDNLLKLYPESVNAFDYIVFDKQNDKLERSYALISALKLHENINVAKVLVENGADVNLVQEFIGSTDGQNRMGAIKTDPLTAAISYHKGNKLEAVSLLLSYGAKPTIYHVHAASAYKENDIVDLLVDVMMNDRK